MFDVITLDYPQFTDIVTKKKARIQYIEKENQYCLFAYDGPIKYYTCIYKQDPKIDNFNWVQEQNNLNDFESKYKPIANRPISFSPVEGESVFKSFLLEILDNQQQGIISIDIAEVYGKDIELRRVRPRPVQAKKGDKVHFEVWAKEGYGLPTDAPLRKFGETYLEGGDGWSGPWYEGVGTAQISQIFILKLIYDKGSDLTYRRFYLDVEVIV